jgi:dTMP kinase
MTPLKIEFEGTDGSGKTTGLKYFIEQARLKGLEVIETREVGNPHVPVCQDLRSIVLNPESKLSGKAMEMIFAGMRYINDEWFSTLNCDLVVSDRGFFSHLAYGHHNAGEWITDKFFENIVGLDTKLPDIVIYFAADSDVALSRRKARGTLDVIEMKGVEYQDKVRESYLDYFKKYPKITVFTLNANRSILDVQEQLDAFLNLIMCYEVKTHR